MLQMWEEKIRWRLSQGKYVLSFEGASTGKTRSGKSCGGQGEWRGSPSITMEIEMLVVNGDRELNQTIKQKV